MFNSSKSHASLFSSCPKIVERPIAQYPKPRDMPLGHHSLGRFLAPIDERWCTIAAPDFPSHKSASPLEHTDFHSARSLVLNNTFRPEYELRLCPGWPLPEADFS
jgi:hypothetical protein